MKTIRKVEKSFKNLFQGGKPTIFHFRLTQPLHQNNVNKCIEKLKNMREAKVPPRVFAVSVNAHTGSFAQAKTLRDALLQTSEDLKSPLYTFAEDYALEAGYYLLSAGHKIYANPFSLIGDVGVTMRSPKFDKLAKKYLNVVTIKAGRDKTSIFPWEKTAPETAEFFNKVLDNFYKEMCQKIMESRELALKEKGLTDAKITKDIFSGRTFTAKEALDAGLIDGITTFEEFKAANYKDFAVSEHTLDRNRNLTYRQIKTSVDNWNEMLQADHASEHTFLESFDSEAVESKVRFAENLLDLFQSEEFLVSLREYINEDVMDALNATIRNRMSMDDVLRIVDESEGIHIKNTENVIDIKL